MYIVVRAPQAGPLNGGERDQVTGHAASQGAEVITSFQDADDPTVAMLIGDIDQSPRHLLESFFAQVHLRQRVLAMRVETRRDQQHLRAELIKSWHHALVDRAEII